MLGESPSKGSLESPLPSFMGLLGLRSCSSETGREDVPTGDTTQSRSLQCLHLGEPHTGFLPARQPVRHQRHNAESLCAPGELLMQLPYPLVLVLE